MQLHESAYGQIRHVTLRTPLGRLISRPINKCYPLELAQERESLRPGQNNTVENNSNRENQNNEQIWDGQSLNTPTTQSKNLPKPQPNDPPTRPTRKAKIMAQRQMKKLYEKSD